MQGFFLDLAFGVLPEPYLQGDLLTAVDCGCFYITCALEAEFHRLACTDIAVPAKAGCGVRVVAADARVPGAGDAGRAAVLPARRPT